MINVGVLLYPVNMQTPLTPGRLATLQSMLTRVSRAIEAALRDEATSLELTPAQAEALRFAGTIRPDVATVGQLARVLGVRHTTAIGVLRPLIERGLIERRTHPYSARQHILALTATGQALLERLEGVESEIARVVASLAPDDAAALERGLHSLAAGFGGSGLLVVPAPCRGCVYFDEDSTAGAEAPHYCRLIRRYLTDDATRMPCPEHYAAPAAATG